MEKVTFNQKAADVTSVKFNILITVLSFGHLGLRLQIYKLKYNQMLPFDIPNFAKNHLANFLDI